MKFPVIHRAGEAIHAASPSTKVVVSLNREVLGGLYGKGDYLPFGKLVLPRLPDHRATPPPGAV